MGSDTATNIPASASPRRCRQLQMRTLSTISTMIVILTSCSNKDQHVDNQTIVTNDPNTFFIVKYYANGAIHEILTTNKDSSQTVKTDYDSSGTLLFSAIIKNNIQTHVTEYYPNGRPRGLTNFDSTNTGDATYYFDNAQKSSEGHWEKFKQVGVWREYNKKGELIKIDTLK
jgi:antitoxin component YwqK of YwqJK toxin-antitoxin module